MSVKVEVVVLGFPSLIVLNMVSDCGRKAALNLKPLSPLEVLLYSLWSLRNIELEPLKAA